MSNNGWSSEASWDISVCLELLTSNFCFLCQTVKNFCGCEMSPSFSVTLQSRPASAVLRPAASFIVRLMSVFIRCLTGCLHVLQSQSMLSENKVFLMRYVRAARISSDPTKTNETTLLHLLQHSNTWKEKKKFSPPHYEEHLRMYLFMSSSNVRPKVMAVLNQYWSWFHCTAHLWMNSCTAVHVHTLLMKCRNVLWPLSLWMLTCDSHQPWHWASLNHQHWHRKRTKRSKLVYGQIKYRQTVGPFNLIMVWNH